MFETKILLLLCVIHLPRMYFSLDFDKTWLIGNGLCSFVRLQQSDIPRKFLMAVAIFVRNWDTLCTGHSVIDDVSVARQQTYHLDLLPSRLRTLATLYFLVIVQNFIMKLLQFTKFCSSVHI